MGGSSGRRMTEEQKVERRERNREHAKRSRVRKKFLLESLQKSVNALQEENDKLRGAIRTHLKDGADDLLKTCEVEPEDSLLTSDPASATKILDDPDYTLVKALQTAQQNFVITDPTLPDNRKWRGREGGRVCACMRVFVSSDCVIFLVIPLAYPPSLPHSIPPSLPPQPSSTPPAASGGFLDLTGYQMDQILSPTTHILLPPSLPTSLPPPSDRLRLRGVPQPHWLPNGPNPRPELPFPPRPRH